MIKLNQIVYWLVGQPFSFLVMYLYIDRHLKCDDGDFLKKKEKCFFQEILKKKIGQNLLSHTHTDKPFFSGENKTNHHQQFRCFCCCSNDFFSFFCKKREIPKTCTHLMMRCVMVVAIIHRHTGLHHIIMFCMVILIIFFLLFTGLILEIIHTHTHKRSLLAWKW